MKQLIITSLLLIFATSASAHLSRVQDNDSINIILLPGENDGNVPHRTTNGQDVYGIYSQVNQSLTLFVVPEITIIRVRIYCNGTMVIDDSNPVLSDDTLYYNMSSFVSGTYTVQLDADDGTVYIGTFTL